MKKIQPSIIIVISLLILILAVGFTPRSSALAAVPPALVEVVNKITNPVPVKLINDPAASAYQEEATVSIQDGAYAAAIFFSPIPAGKRLVVQYVSVEIQVQLGQTARAAFVTKLNGTTAFHQFPIFHQGVIAGSPTNRDVFTGGLEMPVYQDGGLAPGIDLSRSSADGSAFAVGTLSGYLVDMP